MKAWSEYALANVGERLPALADDAPHLPQPTARLSRNALL